MGNNVSSLHYVEIFNSAVDTLVADLSKVQYEKSLGSARLLKTLKAYYDSIPVVVKVFVKPSPNFRADEYTRKEREQTALLKGCSNCISYQQSLETERAVYLFRHFVQSNLYDRISTRPFLEHIEKKWITFQLLTCLKDCHAKGVRHGDIKSENVLITSWTWANLVDFAFYKPTYLPEDNPADFVFFFDTSSRRMCYLAPERFLQAGETKEGEVTDAMDIFSLGCVIAELFLEGVPLFNLSQLFNYRNGTDSEIMNATRKIEDPSIRSLVRNMIALDPSKRLSAAEYLEQWRDTAFPAYFSSILHQYISNITDSAAATGPKPTPTVTSSDMNDSVPDLRLTRLHSDFDKITFFLAPNDHRVNAEVDKPKPSCDVPSEPANSQPLLEDSGALILLSLITSSVRSATKAESRVFALDLFASLNPYLSDYAKLERCLPFVMTLLSDSNAFVRAIAIRFTCELLRSVRMISPVNAFVFQEYILPRCRGLLSDSQVMVRSSYASSIGDLALTAGKFLEMAHAMRRSGAFSQGEIEVEEMSSAAQDAELYESSHSDLSLLILDHTIILLTDPEPTVRRSLLLNINSIGVFLGASATKDVLISHLITFLNDSDWRLRQELFTALVSLSMFVTDSSFEQFVLPLIVQTFTDPEETVCAKMIEAMVPLIELRIIGPPTIWLMVNYVSKLLIHPNVQIRRASVQFIAAVAETCDPVDLHCILMPKLLPFLYCSLSEINETSLIENLIEPLSRPLLDNAIAWSSKAERSHYWKNTSSSKGPTSFDGVTSILKNFSLAGLSDTLHNRRFLKRGSGKSPEDDNFIAKLKNLGMSPQDEMKIEQLKPFIAKRGAISQDKSRDKANKPAAPSTTIPVQSLNVVPHTVFFEKSIDERSHKEVINLRQRNTTVEQALEGASHTIGSAPRRSSSRIGAPNQSTDISSKRLVSDLHKQSQEHANLHAQPKISNTHPEVPEGKTEEAASPTESGTDGAAKTAYALQNKSAARTGTSDMNALGTVDLPDRTDRHEVPTTSNRAATISYDGDDPNVLKLLENVYTENFQESLEGFGPSVYPRLSQVRSDGGQTRDFMPNGTLIANLTEHHSAVTRILVVPDSRFFLTASEDGTLKVWDSARLEKNVANRSRLTYRHPGTPAIKAACVIQNTYCVASGASDGSIHILRVDCSPSASAGIKYTGIKSVQSHQLEDGAFPLWLEHVELGNASNLIIATSLSQIISIDLRTKKRTMCLQIPLLHGIPLNFVVDRKKNWLVSGTDRGVLDLWDLRFQVHLRSWGLPGLAPVYRLFLHPTRGRGKWVCAATSHAGCGEVSVWDIEKLQCREVYKIGEERLTTKDYSPDRLDHASHGPLVNELDRDKHEYDTKSSGIRAIAIGTGIGPNYSTHCIANFMVSGGDDSKIRFWHLGSIEKSRILSGVDPEERPTAFFSVNVSPTLCINCEVSTESGQRLPATAKTIPTAPKKLAKPSRTTIISLHQQQMLKMHMDVVQEIALLESPYTMIISGDRSGVIKIYS